MVACTSALDAEAAKMFVFRRQRRCRPHFLLERFGRDGELHLAMEGRHGALSSDPLAPPEAVAKRKRV